jgi:hypothetical protein
MSAIRRPSRRAAWSIRHSVQVQPPARVTAHRPYTREALDEAVQAVLWWPSALALLVLGLTYSLVSDRLTIGPPWLVLAVVVVALALIYLLRWKGLHTLRRVVALLMLVAVTLAVAASAVFLLVSPSVADLSALELLRGALLLWASNILNFALWYWEVDGGGPLRRMLRGTPPSTDFAFPPQQQAVLSGQQNLDWSPQLVDYLFLAFTSSSTFGPTDTLVMARRAKVLMMLQSSLSLIIFGGIVARAVGNLH